MTSGQSEGGSNAEDSPAQAEAETSAHEAAEAVGHHDSLKERPMPKSPKTSSAPRPAPKPKPVPSPPPIVHQGKVKGGKGTWSEPGKGK